MSNAIQVTANSPATVYFLFIPVPRFSILLVGLFIGQHLTDREACGLARDPRLLATAATCRCVSRRERGCDSLAWRRRNRELEVGWT